MLMKLQRNVAGRDVNVMSVAKVISSKVEPSALTPLARKPASTLLILLEKSFLFISSTLKLKFLLLIFVI